MADGDATFFVDDAPAPRTIAFPNGDGTFIVFEVDDEEEEACASCVSGPACNCSAAPPDSDT